MKNPEIRFIDDNIDWETKQLKEVSVPLTGIKPLPAATIDEETKELIASKATYSIIMWIDETGSNQTKQDSGQIFAGGIIVEASGADGNGITGVFTAGGVDNE